MEDGSEFKSESFQATNGILGKITIERLKCFFTTDGPFFLIQVR